MYYNCDYECNCKGRMCIGAKKKTGGISLSKFKFELAGNGNQRLVLEWWTGTRWVQPSRWFQGTEQAVEDLPQPTIATRPPFSLPVLCALSSRLSREGVTFLCLSTPVPS
jgi:hypothetical protein